MSEEEERSEKQAYLRSAILDTGYSGDKFISHLEAAKGNCIVIFRRRS